jgi:hypothetical protein
MNPPVNRPSESPSPPGKSQPEANQLQKVTAKQPHAAANLADAAAAETARQQPIPPPSHPLQYRAIGLIQGIYERSEDYLNRGILVTEEGCRIEAVILGRAISLVKKHLDLEKSHLWVVYPRTRPDNDQFHAQIVGVWEPETLHPPAPESAIDSRLSAPVEHGYFSVRGEVIFSAPEKKKVIVKIRQSSAKKSEKPKFFKLKLQGILPERPVSRFWDFQVQLQGDILSVQSATDLGLIRNKPLRKFKKPFRPTKSTQPISSSSLAPEKRPKPSLGRKFTPKPLIDKPKKDKGS